MPMYSWATRMAMETQKIEIHRKRCRRENITGHAHFLTFSCFDRRPYLSRDRTRTWLIDAIASYQNHKRIRTNPMLRDFQLWELKVRVKDGRRSATLTMRADSDQGTIIRQRIEYTDFPLDLIKLYVEGDTLLLPTEH